MKLEYPPGATPLAPDERKGLLPSSISTQAELNEFEQAAIREAADWALGARQRDVLSEAFVRKLHGRMFKGVWSWAGKYRTTNKNIGIDWHQVPAEVVKLCADAAHWIEHRTYEWTELGARFHHRLVSIHPFPNGNGRHSRLMTDALLRRHAQPLFTWGKTNLVSPGGARDQYIKALREADERRLGPLVTFVRS
jgi:Fic-DOC domain mobile mystery protein B